MKTKTQLTNLLITLVLLLLLLRQSGLIIPDDAIRYQAR